MASTISTAAARRPCDTAEKEPVFNLRPYQSRMVQTALQENTIIVLPTGAGKTVIAAEVILQYGAPALFLVPTVLLVEQQCSALRSWTQLDVQPFHGGIGLPSRFHILVSTPKAFETAQQNAANTHLQWESMEVIVFDEVHHVLKEHPYRKLALSLHKSAVWPRVLGLTASYTYAVGEKEMKETLWRICEELRVTRLETATSEELREGGYHTSEIKAEVSHAEFKYEPPTGVLPEEERKPHVMMKTFFSRVLQNTATPFSSRLAKCVLQLEVAMAHLDPSFEPPIQSGDSVKQWGVVANEHSLMNNPDIAGMFRQLEHWYEALRLLVVSWEEDEYAAVVFLRMQGCHLRKAIDVWAPGIAALLLDFWSEAPREFRRLANLRSVLIQKYKLLQKFRGIVFVQQRVTTHILEYFIKHDEMLQSLFSAASLHASSTPATPWLNISKTEAQSRLDGFAKGRVNLLITTVVAEEGMDVSAANCVIRFDAMHHAVSLVQGRGRARQENSAFVVLREREDRPVAKLGLAEKRQLELARTYRPGASGAGGAQAGGAQASAAQRSREAGAVGLLGGPVDATNAMLKLRALCQKTKVGLVCQYQQRGGDFTARLTYRSVLRAATGEGGGRSRKAAVAQAAVALMGTLRQELGG